MFDQSRGVACLDESGFMEIGFEDRVCLPAFQRGSGACCEGDASGVGSVCGIGLAVDVCQPGSTCTCLLLPYAP